MLQFSSVVFFQGGCGGCLWQQWVTHIYVQPDLWLLAKSPVSRQSQGQPWAPVPCFCSDGLSPSWQIEKLRLSNPNKTWLKASSWPQDSTRLNQLTCDSTFNLLGGLHWVNKSKMGIGICSTDIMFREHTFTYHIIETPNFLADVSRKQRKAYQTPRDKTTDTKTLRRASMFSASLS